MRIITVGGTGFLGRHVAQAFGEAGHENLLLTRHKAGLEDLQLIPGVRLQQTDVYEKDALARHFSGADVVVSMAGILNESGFDGAGFRRVHVELVAAVIEACQAAGVSRILHVSAINAGQGESFYLQSKGEAEALLKASGLDVTLLRPSVIFGPGDGFFNRFATLLRLAPALPLACAESRLQPVWVGDVATAMVQALEREDAIGATWELGGPTVYTLGELVRWTAATLGLSRWVPGLPDAVARLQGRIMDFVPGKPFSTDNYRSLQRDNVTSNNILPQLGIEPRSIESVVPDYLCPSPRQQRLNKSRRSRDA
ncbi:MAG: complex I NDUFA9 subunit family protein [Xanthomonadales bacterium]|nr:complex I NDUFA9 subunit family protein [Xanthomonadales bacterium]